MNNSAQAYAEASSVQDFGQPTGLPFMMYFVMYTDCHHCKLTLVPLPGNLTLNSEKGLCLRSFPGYKLLLNAN
jgi:hypothetical protein